MRKNMKKIQNKMFLLSVVAIGTLLAVIGLFYSSFALVDPVKSISFTSEKLNYNEKDSGSWKIEHSAEWISKGQAKVTITLDTVERIKNRNTDMIFVLDTSGSMKGEKLQQAKSDIKELFNFLLDIEGNKGALITFDQDSTILSEFTEDRDRLLNAVDGLYDRYTTNYYQALVNVNEILRNYQHEEDRDLVVVFMTDGIPNEDTPNEKNYYKYLKDAYPYITVNAVQYEMGSAILDSVKNISDNQYIANIKTLKEVLFQASKVPVPYSEFKIENYIDTDYFSIESENDIKVDRGIISFNKEEQKVAWNLDNLPSGTSSQMTIDVVLKEEYQKIGGIYSTNRSTKVSSRIENDIESVENGKTPRLKNEYQVVYDGNLPEGCVVENIPGSKNYFTFDSVEIEEGISCDGYQFKGWKIVTEKVNRPSENYFIMPESDVILRGEWSDLSIAKSIDGTINQYVPPVLQKIGVEGYNKELWKYKNSITKIVFQDQIKDIKEATETFDISEGKNYGVVGYIVPNTDDVSTTTYTAYIQGDGKIKANQDSSYLFHSFTNVESIEGLEYLDTSDVTNMHSMFDQCKSLTNLNLSSFDTSNVTNMRGMFWGSVNLKNLDLSNFDTSKVTNMSLMFGGNYYNRMKLGSLDLSSFNTSNVTDMSSMFSDCSSLTNLNISGFDTSNVTDMSSMFASCSALISLNVSNFNTSKVINMSSMFVYCINLTSLDLSNFDTSNVTDMSSMFGGHFYSQLKLKNLNISSFNTSKVTNMSGMFSGCYNLVSLDVSHFNTSKVTNMSWMFSNCNSLTSLDVSNFDTSKVNNMSSMFAGDYYNSHGLKSLDLSNFDTSNVTNMSGMFYHCINLTTLDLSSFNTSNVTSMRSMFFGCSSLPGLDLSNFDTSNVTDMSGMFGGDYNNDVGLKDLNIGFFDTSKVKDMHGMFYNCKNLTSLDLRNFDTSNVTNMSEMFGGNFNCHNGLKNLNIGSFNTSKVKDMHGMFSYCTSLISLDLSNFNTLNVTNMENMFDGCTGLTSLNIGNFNTSNVTDMRYIFNRCSSLTNLDLSSFDTSKVVDMRYMFNKCSALENLNLTSFDTSLVTNMEYMFNECNHLNTTITISNPNTTGYTSMFTNASTIEGANITVNYTNDTSDLVDLMISTKSSTSNILKGMLVSL